MSAIRIGWLPLGPIVMPRGERLPRMVVARMVGDAREGVLHEYAGCLYPLGDVDDEHRRCFDGDDVESVAFLGYKGAAEDERSYVAAVQAGWLWDPRCSVGRLNLPRFR